jgi:hypothetical protein
MKKMVVCETTTGHVGRFADLGARRAPGPQSLVVHDVFPFSYQALSARAQPAPHQRMQCICESLLPFLRRIPFVRSYPIADCF